MKIDMIILAPDNDVSWETRGTTNKEVISRSASFWSRKSLQIPTTDYMDHRHHRM